MPLTFLCQACRKRLTVPNEFIGQRGVCSHCDAAIVAPLAGGPGKTDWPLGRRWSRTALVSAALLAIVLVAWLGSLVGSRGEEPEAFAPGAAPVVVGPFAAAPPPVPAGPVLPAALAPPPLAPAGRVQVGLAPLSLDQLVARYGPSVAVVRGPDSSGFGFVVAPGLVATNARTIAATPAKAISVLFPSAPAERRGPLSVEVAHFDEDLDLAILAIDSRLAPLEIEEHKEIRQGDPVSVLGFSRNHGLEAEARRGVVGPRISTGGPTSYQLPGAVGGYYGAPVFDAEGRVLGVVSSKTGRQGVAGSLIAAEQVGVATRYAATGGAFDRADAAARHAEQIRRLTLDAEAPGLKLPDPRAGGRPKPLGSPNLLVPDPAYQVRVGDLASVLRDQTPASESWEALDDYARRELAGDAEGTVAAVQSGAVVLLPRRTDLRVVEVREPAPPKHWSPGDFSPIVNAVGEFNTTHPAGIVVLGAPLYGPLQGKTVYMARVDVGRFKTILRKSPEALGPLASTVRVPRRQKPITNPEAKAAAALKLAEAIEAAGRVDEALRAYQSIVVNHPGTPAAAKASERVDGLTGKPRKTMR